jgi:MFS family permease
MNQIKQKLSDSAAMRWAMLALVSTVMFATYYINDIFSGMKSVMETQLGISSGDYGLLLGSVGVFNVIGMIMVGGYILDKFGIRKTGFIFVGIAALGSFLIAYGGSEAYANGGFGYKFMSSIYPDYSPQLKMMILGRLLFGLGLETCCVLVQKVLVKWFKGKELALAFAVNMGVGRFGSSLAIMMSPILAGSIVDGLYPEFPTALWFGFVLAALALLFFLVYNTFDLKFDRQLKQIGDSDEAVTEDKKEAAAQTAAETSAAGKPKGLFKRFVAWFKTTSLYKLVTNLSFVYITLLCVTFYSAVFPFMGYVTDMLVNKFGFKLELASKISAAIPIVTIFFSILFGRIVDKKGKSATLMIYGSLLLIFAHLTLSLTDLPPYLGLAALGVAFSLVPAAMWPAVAKIVDENNLGFAYSIMFTIQNWGLTAFFILIGTVLEATNPGVTAELIDAGKAHYNYTTTVLMLAFLGFLGVMFAFLLKREDKKKSYGLELPSGVKG